MKLPFGLGASTPAHMKPGYVDPATYAYTADGPPKKAGMFGVDPMTWLMLSGALAKGAQPGGSASDALMGAAGAFQNMNERRDATKRETALKAAQQAMAAGDMKGAMAILSQAPGLAESAFDMQYGQAQQEADRKQRAFENSFGAMNDRAVRTQESEARAAETADERAWREGQAEKDRAHDIRLAGMKDRAGGGGDGYYRPASAEEVTQAGLPPGTAAQVNLANGKIEILARPSVQSGALPTEGERKFGMYQRSASRAADSLSGMEEQGYNRMGWNIPNAASAALNALPFVNGVEFDQRARKYDQETSVLVESWLRARSGGAATNDEMEMYTKQIAPQPGDGPEVRQRKNAFRQQMVRDLEVGAGRAAMPAAPAAPDTQDAPPKPNDIVDGYRFLGGDPGDPNSWEAVR